MSYSKLLSPFLLLFSIVTHAEPLYWSAEKGSLSYALLGSVHVGEASMFPMPESMTQKLLSADALIVEADIMRPKGVRYPATTTTVQKQLNDEQLEALGRIARMSGSHLPDLT